MFRILIFIFVCANLAWGAEVNIYSHDIKKNKDLIIAKSGVIVISPLYYISANKALFHENTKQLELFGNVNIIRGENERSVSQYSSLDLRDDSAKFNDFFFANTQLEVWLKAKKSCYKKGIFTALDSTVSSCNVDDPDWKIKFSRGQLDKKTGVLKLHNARLYIKSIPIMYLPYFSFSTSTQRRSGLLIPHISVKSEEGLYYKQPIYIVINNQSDLTLNPQVRTKRGFGMTTQYRFVGENSNLRLDMGYFNDKSKYQRKENLENKDHYGFNLKYSQDKLIKSLLKVGDKWQEGLWIDANYLNDIDYLNLSNQDDNYTSLVTSKLNYFIANDDNYFGLYARHYIDTAKLSNQTTMQEYPALQYHRFLENAFIKDLYFSFDTSFRNYYRGEGLRARQLELNLPMTYQKSFLDDYLNFKITNTLYLNSVNYSSYHIKQEDLFQSFHEFSLYSELARRYASFGHTMNMSFNFFLPGLNGGKISQGWLKRENDEKNVNAKFVQFFYNDAGEKKIRHQVQAKYLLEPGKDHNVDLENELAYFYNEYLSLSNEFNYSGELKKFDKVFSELKFEANGFATSINHSYRVYDGKRYNYLGTHINYKFDNNYELFAELYYDLANSDASIWSTGYTFRRKCWSYSLVYRVSTDPKLTSAGINSKSQKGVYLLFNFYPIGGIGYDFSLQDHETKI